MPFAVQIDSIRTSTRASSTGLPCALFATREEAEMAVDAVHAMRFDVDVSSWSDERSDGTGETVPREAEVGRAFCRIVEVEDEICTRPFRPSARGFPRDSLATTPAPPPPLDPRKDAWIMLTGAYEPRACYRRLADAEIALGVCNKYPEEVFGTKMAQVTYFHTPCVVKVPVGRLPPDFPPTWQPEMRGVDGDVYIPPELLAVLQTRQEIRDLTQHAEAQLHAVLQAEAQAAEARSRALIFLRSLPNTNYTPRARATAARAHSTALRAIAMDPTEDKRVRDLAEAWLRDNGDNRECSVINIAGRNIEWRAEDVEL